MRNYVSSRWEIGQSKCLFQYQITGFFTLNHTYFSIWNDVMGQLRLGIKLKKVDYSKTPTEFELTPYEMLMDDIRKRSYKLNPTEITLKVKTDAKDIILDFIRSRPPLKAASKRILPPRIKNSTPMELLMEVKT